MKTFWQKFRSLMLDGILLLLPLVGLIYLIKFIIELIEPLTYLLPEGGIFGMGMKNFAAITLLLILIIAAGFVSKTTKGTWLSDTLENIVMKVIPGFSVIKKLFYDQKEDDESRKIKSALAYIDDAWLFAFILEEKNDAGLLTVFVPSAPIPTSGNIYLMTEEQVKRLDVPKSQIVKCLTQLGIGSPKILEGKIKM